MQNTSPVNVTRLRHRDTAQSMDTRIAFGQQTLPRGSGPSSSSGVTPLTAQTVIPDGFNTFLTDPAQARLFDTNFGFSGPSPITANLLDKLDDSLVNNFLPSRPVRQGRMDQAYR